MTVQTPVATSISELEGWDWYVTVFAKFAPYVIVGIILSFALLLLVACLGVYIYVLVTPDPPGDDYSEAARNAGAISSKLQDSRREAERQWPDLPQLLDLVDRTLQVLRSQYGGQLPEEFFKTCRERSWGLCCPVEQRAHMDRIMRKWLNKESRKEEFGTLYFCYPTYSSYNVQLTPEKVSAVVEFMQDWIERQKY